MSYGAPTYKIPPYWALAFSFSTISKDGTKRTIIFICIAQEGVATDKSVPKQDHGELAQPYHHIS